MSDLEQWIKKEYVAGSTKRTSGPESAVGIGLEEAGSDGPCIGDKVRVWIIALFIESLRSCTTKQDQLEALAWLALVREILENPFLSSSEKIREVYRLVDSRKFLSIVLHSVAEAVRNYRESSLPLSIKVAIPSTLAAAAFVGGQGAGIAALGSAVGVPVLLLFFIGAAGITSIIEALLSNSESCDYMGVVAALIAKDEVLRRAKKGLREAMASKPESPVYFEMPQEEKALREKLIRMDPYDFERHVMSFFQAKGMLALG